MVEMNCSHDCADECGAEVQQVNVMAYHYWNPHVYPLATVCLTTVGQHEVTTSLPIHLRGRPYAHGVAYVTTAAASVIAILQAFDLFHGHDRGHDHGHGHVGQGVGNAEDANEREDESEDANEGVDVDVDVGEGVPACANDYCLGHHDLGRGHDRGLDPARGRKEKMSPPTTTTGESGASADESTNANEMMATKNAYWPVHDAGDVRSLAVHQQYVEVGVVSSAWVCGLLGSFPMADMDRRLRRHLSLSCRARLGRC